MDREPTAPLSQTYVATALESPAQPDKAPKPSQTTLLIYSRDFAYPNNGPIVVLPARMANADISNASAKTYADTEIPCSAQREMEDERLWKIMLTEKLRKRLLSGPIVDIYVGESKKHWRLHQNLLAYHSSYCELEFSSHEVPQKMDTKLELAHDDPKGFELLVKWLYQGILEDSSSFETGVDKYAHAVACHKLWLLCDRFDMIKLKNLAMDQYRRCLNESHLVPDADEICDIYHDSPVDSPFRQLMVKIAARQIMDPEIERDTETYRKCFERNPDFSIEMIKSIRQMSNGILFNDPTRGDACSYHDHAAMSSCPLLGKGKPRSSKTASEGRFGEGNHTPRPSSPLSQVDSMPGRRTPRKLRTPFKTPSAALKGQPFESTTCESPKLNGTGVRVTAQGVFERRPTDDRNPALEKSPSKPTETLQLRIPARNADQAKVVPDEASLLLPKRSSKKPPAVKSTETLRLNQTWPPETPRKPKLENPLVPGIEQVVDLGTQHLNGDLGKNLNAPPTSSRKRKIADRTPRKLREKQPTTVLFVDRGSTGADDCVSGPRKLRVSSIVQRLNESSSDEASRAQDKARRQSLKVVDAASADRLAASKVFARDCNGDRNQYPVHSGSHPFFNAVDAPTFGRGTLGLVYKLQRPPTVAFNERVLIPFLTLSVRQELLAMGTKHESLQASRRSFSWHP